MNTNKILFTAIIMGLGAGLYAQSPAELRGVIQELSGTVEIKAAASSTWTAARKGDTLNRDTMLSTGFKSSAVLALGNSILTVKPLTRLTLEELTKNEGKDQTTINMRAGRVRAEVNPPSGKSGVNFTIRTPSATASVRGTLFDLDTLTLQVHRGTVALSGNRSSFRWETPTALIDGGGSGFIDASTGKAVIPSAINSEGFSPALPMGIESGARGSSAGAEPGDASPGDAPPDEGNTVITIQF